MKKYVRYAPLAVVLLLPFLAPLSGSKAQWDANNRMTRYAGVMKPASNLSQGQQTVVGNSGKGEFLGNLDLRLNEPITAAKLAHLSSAQIAQKARKHALAMEKASMRLGSTIPGIDARVSPLTGAVEVLRSHTGALSDRAPGRTGEDIVRSFIQNNAGLYGFGQTDVANLNFIGESVSPASGMRMVRVEQTVNGLPVFQSETRFILDAGGRVFRSTGLLVPNATATTPELDRSQLLSAQEALGQAMASVDISVETSPENLTANKAEAKKTEVIANNPHILGKVTSKLVYFPIAPGVLIPAWSQITFTDGSGDWYTVVDANSGTLLWRKNIRDSVSTQDARFRVYVQADGTTPADSPAPFSPTTATPGSGFQPSEITPAIVSMFAAQDITASPNGWIDDCPGGVCTASHTQTIGNNVHAYLDALGGTNANVPDTDPTFMLDGNGKPTGNPDLDGRNRDFLGTMPRNFETGFLPPPQGGNPEAGQTASGNGSSGTAAIDSFRRGVITQVFYVANWYHDRLYRLGFDEAAGNFQQTNFTGTGSGNDRMLVEAEDSSSTNNANFATPPDGVSGRAQMFRFTGPATDRDGDLDTEVLLHELTHGLSNRLVGNAAGLLWDPARGMGEGWSDFYALSLLNNTKTDDPDGAYAFGAYATYRLSGLAYFDNYVYGIRRLPYSTNNAINPLTWADVDDVSNDLSGGIAPDPLGYNKDGGFEVHNIGELWALTLWEVRSRIIAANAGDVPSGNQKMLQIVTDAVKMTPINPTFTDARDALLDADCVTNACANEQSIWAGFADRGLGYKASTPVAYGGRYVRMHMAIHESFSSPFLEVRNVATDLTIDDSFSNNNGSVDPGEAVKLTLQLTNPWRNPVQAVTSATGTLTTSTAGVTVLDNSSTYGAIAQQGTAAGDPFTITVARSVACGSTLNFTLTTVSNLGTTSTDFSLRVGARSGTDPVVTYTGSPSPALTIANNSPKGAFHQINITDDLEIADLNFRVDSITHPNVGDLTVLLRAPNGYGTDLITLIGGLHDRGGASITNMIIDDDLPATRANDMVQASKADSPYTRSWLPAYNSPWLVLVGPNVPGDPVGVLGRLDGLSTKGTWTAMVADVSSAGTWDTDGNGSLNGWSIMVTPAHYDCTAFEAQVWVEDIPDHSIKENGSDSFSFGVGDSLSIISVTATSSNTALVSAAALEVAGAGSTRTMAITPAAHQFGTTIITVTAENTGGKALETFVLTVDPIAETPSVTDGATNEDTLTPSGQLVISHNAADSSEVSHFKITGITGGSLFKNDGATPINNGDFISFAQGNAGLRFLPLVNSPVSGSFTVRASVSASDAGLGGGTATATITINPLGGVIQFSAANYSVAEDAGFRTITVERTGDSSQAVTVEYANSDHSNPPDFVPCTFPGAGLASSRCDFDNAIGTLRFGAGQTSKTFNVLINQDNYVEGPETLDLTLSNPTGEAVLGVPATSILEITDDATEGATNPVDNASDFVRALYHDMLNREPDGPGLAFWTDNIEKCNDPARRPAGQMVTECVDKQRESTAIAFFMSPEFQMTGGFVYRLYKGSLTGVPNHDGGSSGLLGRFPTSLEFMRDVSQVSEGIVVNNQIDGTVVEANRNRLAAEFVQRPEFLTKYGGLNHTLFVQELFNTTGIAATAGDKQALVDGLGNGTETRASVLRKVVDGTVVISEGNVQFTTSYGQAFYDQEFRRVFVYMEYVGFLRRNPDAPGFIFWLGKLNLFNGDPFQAEMVKSFILSPEYRSRFGQP